MGKSSNKSTVVVATIVGALAGATTALLLSPKSGDELREDLNKGVSQAKDKALEWKDQAYEKTSELKGKADEKTNELKDKADELKNEASDKADDLKEKMTEQAKKATEKAQQTLKEIDTNDDNGEEN